MNQDILIISLIIQLLEFIAGIIITFLVFRRIRRNYIKISSKIQAFESMLIFTNQSNKELSSNVKEIKAKTASIDSKLEYLKYQLKQLKR